MSSTDTDQRIRTIKADLRAMMNGVASAAMREAGLTQDYRVNFGVELPRLKEMAEELRHELAEEQAEQQAENPTEQPAAGTLHSSLCSLLSPLSQALWHERVRECRILALLLYPAERMEADLAQEWAADIRQVELAQLAALLLFSHIPDAGHCAFQWIASSEDIRQILGYYTLVHLLRQHPLAPRSQQELADQAATALTSGNPQLVRAARCALQAVETTATEKDL